MPWKVDSTMSLRREFVIFASAPGANVAEEAAASNHRRRSSARHRTET
jgi:hypothetical protein